jgi:uncharacterized DUF497 family protein
MKTFVWDAKKNERLQQERGISFEKIIAAIEHGRLLDILDHPGKKYKDQKLYVVEIDQYVYIAPCYETENEILMMTIFPSRKFTKFYLNKEYKKP